MNKKITLSILVVLLLVTAIGIFFAFHSSKKIVVVSEPDFTKSTPFMNMMSECPSDINVSDRFVCISKLAKTTETEVDTLANKLITQAPVRLKEITSKNTGPASFEYGGEDFLTALPEVVREAQKVRSEYVASVCNLAQMNIFGGSGMDLEAEACRYYYTEQYLKILKHLERGLSNDQ